MPAAQTIYDASAMWAVAPSTVAVTTFGVVAFSTMAALGWRQVRPATVRDGTMSDPPRILAVLAFSAMSAFSIGYLAFAGIEDLLWKTDYANHRYEVLDGCVRDFSEEVQTSHDLGVDTFTVDGRAFRLSDSDWRLGYHLSHHHGSPIEEGTHLRVFANGPNLLRIDVLSTGC